MLYSNPVHSFLILCFDAWKKLELAVFTIFNPFITAYLKKVFSKGEIIVNGDKPWDMKVKDNRIWPRLMSQPTIALGELYIDGWWECEAIEEFFFRVFKYNIHHDYLTIVNRMINFFGYYWFNLQTKQRAFEVGEKHYDLGNDLFNSFLDPYLQYSCAYWKTARNLNDAQLDKLELIAKKLKLKPGMTVLEIGCGWGGLCQYLAEKYQVQVVGVTVSVEGAKIARERCRNLPVDIHVMDYRDIPTIQKNGLKYDRVVSIAMFEAVGLNNYREFFKIANESLVDDGLFLLHTIGVSHPDMPQVEPFICKYIFPNGVLPYTTQILTESDGLFVLEDWHNFGHDYYKTLMAWDENFRKSWPTIEKTYGPKFFRFWTYYLRMCAGIFKARKCQLWQVVMSKNGIPGGYVSVR